MTKEDIKEKDAIHCKSLSEFNRIIELFKMNNEHLNWEIYKQNTVLFPFEYAYGEVNGYAKECNYNIIYSGKITHA
jgi:hypothetical protein